MATFHFKINIFRQADFRVWVLLYPLSFVALFKLYIENRKMNNLTLILLTFFSFFLQPASSYDDGNQTTDTASEITLNNVSDIDVSYEDFRSMYYKSSSCSSQYREYVYYNNCQKINEFNQKQSRKFNQYINEFADLTQSQFRQLYASLAPAKAFYDITPSRLLLTLPSVDWSCYSGFVHHQGLCGACYAFASANLADSLYAIYRNAYHIPFSVQELVSCSPSILNNGCSGGMFDSVLSYMKQEGVVSAISYPYTSKFTKNPQPCDTHKIQQGIKRKITDYREISKYCSALILQLEKGPIAAGISSSNLQFYYEGIFQGPINTITDHAVLIVGYNEAIGFKIKNSWGTSWGSLGYGWVSQQLHAGLCSRAVTATVPDQQNQQASSCP